MVDDAPCEVVGLDRPAEPEHDGQGTLDLGGRHHLAAQVGLDEAASVIWATDVHDRRCQVVEQWSLQGDNPVDQAAASAGGVHAEVLRCGASDRGAPQGLVDQRELLADHPLVADAGTGQRLALDPGQEASEAASSSTSADPSRVGIGAHAGMPAASSIVATDRPPASWGPSAGTTALAT